MLKTKRFNILKTAIIVDVDSRQILVSKPAALIIITSRMLMFPLRFPR